MPIYEFECSDCGHRFDRLQRLSDRDPEICPQCGERGLHRCVTAPAFRLAGNGWYETDFKKAGDKKRNLADTGGGASSEGAKAGKTDGAPSSAPAKPEKAAKPAES
ncbi:MAG TPA: zinc ribbon domain-containing protein [Rhodanobacteraceae bacterium]|nr:zinc ribbon domain-containing protein [Rhodanobacteraceae bacterium]